MAKNRALSVRRALIAAGVPAERVLMRRPAVTLGGADAAEARRVEVRVQQGGWTRARLSSGVSR